MPNSALTECNHTWRWVKDWFGDPSVPGGTCDCSHWQCSKCDSEDCDDPPPSPYDDEPEI